LRTIVRRGQIGWAANEQAEGVRIVEHTVLIVDDEENFLHGLARALREQPYRLFTARRGDEAKYVLETRRVDVVVADENMPGMSGNDLLGWVAANYPDVTRILLTGYATAETAIRAINEGAVYQLFRKPCNAAHLAVAIRKALEERHAPEEGDRKARFGAGRIGPPERFNQELNILTHVVDRNLQQPLDVLARSCQSLGEQYTDMFDPKAKTLIQDALDAAAEVRRLVSRLHEHSQEKEPAEATVHDRGQ